MQQIFKHGYLNIWRVFFKYSTLLIYWFITIINLSLLYIEMFALDGLGIPYYTWNEKFSPLTKYTGLSTRGPCL